MNNPGNFFVKWMDKGKISTKIIVAIMLCSIVGTLLLGGVVYYTGYQKLSALAEQDIHDKACCSGSALTSSGSIGLMA